MEDTYDDNQVSLDDINVIAEDINDKILDIDTLEIYKYPHHVACKTEKSKNIQEFEKFVSFDPSNTDADVNELAVNYKDINFSFNRISADTDDYKAYMLLAKEVVDGDKKGLMVVVDASGVIFVITAKVSAMRQLNLDILKVIYPDSQY